MDKNNASHIFARGVVASVIMYDLFSLLVKQDKFERSVKIWYDKTIEQKEGVAVLGIRSLFHKIRIGFVRRSEVSIPYVSQMKKYGNYGEDRFIYLLHTGLPFCQIKRNVLIHTPDGNAEIDCLVLFQNKLFAIEIKSWKGRILEQEDGFLQEKTDRWTEEVHLKYHGSPFRQLGRSIYLLRKQVPEKAWINAVVFFEHDESDSVSVYSDHIWFDHIEDLIHYIQNDGKKSYGDGAKAFFQKCIPADYLYTNAWGKSLPCMILDHSLSFQTKQGRVSRDNMESIHLVHHWSYDELQIKMTDGSKRYINLENAKITVNDQDRICEYALCKLDDIELGKTLIGD